MAEASSNAGQSKPADEGAALEGAALEDAANEGAALEDNASGTEYQTRASHFIQNTSLDDMHAIAEAALRKKMEAPPKWVFPEGGIQQP